MRATSIHATRLGLLLVVLLASTRIHAAWEITRFEVYEGRTVKAADWLQREQGKDKPVLSRPLIDDIEDFLGQSAKRYSDMGFPDPVAAGTLDSVVIDAQGRPAIRVYVRPIPGAPYAYYTSGKPCSEPKIPRKTLNINTLGFKGGKLRGTDYATLAHEMFHAVMEASTFMRQDRCDRGGWITEGMPDAISHYLAAQLRDASFREELAPGQALIGKVFGARPYNRPLNQPELGDYEYFSSSFWRYLAELTAASRRSEKHPGARPYPEDYHYLVDFLATSYGYGRGPVGEITWLDGTMRQHRHIRSSLASVHAQFVSAFADYLHWRINPRKKQLGYQLSKNSAWLRQVLSGCNGAAPVDAEKPSTLDVFVRENAAVCFRLNTAPGLMSGTVVVQVTSESLALLKQLRMGLPDGTLVSAPLIKSRAADTGVHIAQWNFPLLKAGGEEFIIANMADQPATTVPAKITLHFAVESWTSSMTPAIPRTEQAPPAPRAGQTSRREKLKQRTRSAVAKPVEHLQPTTSAARSLPDAACTATDRQFNTCSSQLVIKLQLSPLLPDENFLAGPAVGPELLMQSIVGGDGDSNALQAQMLAGQALDRFLRGNEASEITIRLPQLEYGFSGSIGNASIEVARSGGGRYLSYGRRVPLGNGFISRPPNGRVTVEEYTPLVIRGSFSADLVDPDNPGPDIAPIISRSISGSFSSPSPYLRDEDFVLDQEQIMREGLQNTIEQTPFGADLMQGIVRDSGVSAASLCKQGADEKLLKSLGFTSGCGNTGGEAQPVCSCDCAEREREAADPGCERSCRRRWRDCPLWVGEFPTDLEGQVLALREMMTRQKIPAAMQDVMVESFRTAPAQARLMMLESYR